MSEWDSDLIKVAIGVLFIIAILLFMAFILGHGCATTRYQQEIIERGYALHDPQTGEWRWKEEGE